MPAIFLFVLLMLLTGCREEKNVVIDKQAEIVARQQAELRARQQAEEAQRQADERRDRLHTLRIVAFVALAGGAVAALAWTSRPAPQSIFESTPGLGQRLTPVTGYSAPRRPGRIIDLPPVNPPTGAGTPVSQATEKPTDRPPFKRRRRRYRPANGRHRSFHQPSNPGQS
jgi:hypothetical protein